MTPAKAEPQRTRPGAVPLRRPVQGRVLLGVTAGLSLHLGVPVAAIRWLFALLTLAFGSGVVLYVWFALTVPGGDPQEAAAEARPGRLTRLVPRLRAVTASTRGSDLVVGAALLVVAALLLASQVQDWFGGAWLLPVVVLIAGAALAWSQIEVTERQRRSGQPVRRTSVLLRVGGGLALALLGVVIFVARGKPLGDVVNGVLAGLAILAGTAFVLAPLGLRLWRDLVAERAARARESERADIAAHLHDSVLQTLSLIRSRAEDPAFVRRMARGQERELRDWLYADRPEPGESVAHELRRAAGEVEDHHGVEIDVVTAGDAVPDERTPALVSAAREAMVNAVVHGAPPVSIYVEVGPEASEVYVRDRGGGFDVDAVGEDRHGVRHSIFGRMRRHGGHADIRSDAERGTEVRLHMPHHETSGGRST
ncbi:PspC domain-containing protein [Ruania suaedae]|uniref:ATP-binding protein n=1 Tax=Ruania suaedae TaxID=2897774 RepID=UPI001E344D3E|nr:PspC domain-containing protein [Ruania suaedae]UFU03860.1 PspC domain-containing protein [Ruania suaedae]